jgi:branched-subunit amino acid transport protein AzlD
MEWVRARLPAAIMMVLAVYCLQGAGWGSWPHGLPEAIAALSVAGLHLAFRNMMASIGLGTALYMLLRQVF